MSLGASWLNEIALIERPKPKPPTLKDVLVKMLAETAKGGKVVSIPKDKQGSTQAAYEWARTMGYVHHTERNGHRIYLWWTPKRKK